MTWSGRRLLKVLGVASLAAFVTGAIVWPLAQGYPTLMHLISDGAASISGNIIERRLIPRAGDAPVQDEDS